MNVCPVVLLIMLAPTALSARSRTDWLAPSGLYLGGAVADEWSTRRFLSNGSGCREAAQWIGGSRPAPWKLTAATIGATAVITTMHYAIYRAGKQTNHSTLTLWINRVSGVLGGGIGVHAAINNVRDCHGH